MRELGYFYPSLLYTLTCFKIGEPTPAGHYRYCTVLYHISPNIRELWLYKEVKQLYINYFFFIFSGLDRHGSLKLCTQLLCLFTRHGKWWLGDIFLVMLLRETEDNCMFILFGQEFIMYWKYILIKPVNNAVRSVSTPWPVSNTFGKSHIGKILCKLKDLCVFDE